MKFNEISLSYMLPSIGGILASVYLDIHVTSFDVLLIMHLSITLASDQLDAQLFYSRNTFIAVLYMFRATSCSSSGGQIILIQHLVWSL